MDLFPAVTTDVQGNVHVAGGFGAGGDVGGLSVPTDGHWHVVTAQYDPNGTAQELACAETTDMGFAMAAAVDAAGNRYLAGWYQGTAVFGAYVLPPSNLWNYFLAKLAGPEGCEGQSSDPR